MKKNDLKLIGAFIDTKNPRISNIDLNYAHLKDDGIYATDTRKAIHFNIPMLGLDLLLHKKILAGFTSLVSKDDDVSIDGYGFIKCGLTAKMNCDTFPDFDLKKTDIKRIFDMEFDYKFSLTDIDDIHFELTQKDCFIDDIHLNPIIEYADCTRYEIFFNKQTITDQKTNTGAVKVVGLIDTEDEKDLVKFVAIIIGREFKTKAQEQLLLDI